MIRNSGQWHLLDLDRTGNRLLVLALECSSADRRRRETGLAVFERSGEGWQGISVLTVPDRARVGSWWWEGDRLLVEWVGRFDVSENRTEAYVWNGTVLVPA